MQETRNNCFGSKKRCTSLRQAKSDNHECQNLTENVFSTLALYFSTRAYLFSPEEGSCYVFSYWNNCCEFLATYGVIFQSDIQSYFKAPVPGAPLSYHKVYYYLRRRLVVWQPSPLSIEILKINMWFFINFLKRIRICLSTGFINATEKMQLTWRMSEHVQSQENISMFRALINIRNKYQCSKHQ